MAEKQLCSTWNTLDHYRNHLPQVHGERLTVKNLLQKAHHHYTYMEEWRRSGNECAVGERGGEGLGRAEDSAEAEVTDLDHYAVLEAGSASEDHQAEDLDEKAVVEEEEEEEEDNTSTVTMRPLLFAYDCETTGLSTYNDHVIEIAAEVIHCPVPCGNNITYHSLVKTTREIPREVSMINNITSSMICDERPLSVVLPEFIGWLTTTTQDISTASKVQHYPVLVAHNGFTFDFPILFAEVERHTSKELTLATFKTHRIHFSDTLPLVRKMKKDGHKSLEDISLGLESLYTHILHKELCGVHRALADARAIKAVFTHPTLVKCLRSMDVHSPRQQLEAWFKKKQAYSLTKAFSITPQQARRLATLGLSHKVLMHLWTQSTDSEEFCQTLKSKKVNSAMLREKLAEHLELVAEIAN